ncbi:cytochrome c [Pelomonas sp. SE-A7]|uniref:c-type cytochrome n=1 Tax=Pelomonas sp. SE-A7 TaxID=3054953 RepID=UPI00259CFF3D|nr:cytochrome c [Pelomonas sp. SE-A7]MDM4765471.1 cytochrome c [Pelomonas sp. SE-A7]
MKIRLCAVLLLSTPLAQADDAQFSNGWRFQQRDGPKLYASICAGCHMPDGRGASGAASYPALAGNGKLASKEFVLLTVLNGRGAMPAFGWQLDDAQIAAVSSLVRQRFGKPDYEATRPEEVKALRPQHPEQKEKP